MRRILIVLVATLAVAACGVPGDDGPRAVPEGEVPDALRPGGSAPALEPLGARVDLWFVEGDRLVSRTRRIPRPVAVETVVDRLLTGPTTQEQAGGLRSAIPDADAVLGIVVARGVAEVDLSTTFAEIPVPDQLAAVAQLVLTLTDRPGIGRVQFLVADEPVAVPLADGAQSDEPVARDDFVALTATP